MAKKKKTAFRPAKSDTWFAVLLFLAGIWFMAADLGYISTYGLSLWPIVVALVGLKFWICKK